jgi:hypothetical protein
MLPPTPKSRSVEQCELYLDRLRVAMRRASAVEVRRLLPLVLRFKAELAQANTEEALLQEMLGASAVRVVDEPDERESEHD